MPKRKCRVASCRTYVELPQQYCDKHKGNSNAMYNKHVRQSPDNQKYDTFYHSSQWKSARIIKLSKQPLCEVCLERHAYSVATLVHHIYEIRTDYGWKHRLDQDNLQSICLECHNKQEHPNSFKNRH